MIVTPGGHDLSVWAPARAAAPRLGVVDLASTLGVPAGPATLLVAGAHPDDETIGLGRLAHHWAVRVGPTVAVVATAGEACVDHVGPRPSGLAERRVAEWHVALDRLGFGDRSVLDLPDGRVAEHETDLAAALGDAATRHRPAALGAPWRHDPHPDHRAVGRAAARAAEQLGLPLIEFPVWMTYWADPSSVGDAGQALGVVTVDPDDDQAWSDAVDAYESQLEPLGPGLGPVVPAAMLEHQREQLVLLPTTTRPSGGRP